MYVISDSSWAKQLLVEAGVLSILELQERDMCFSPCFDCKIHETRQRVTHFSFLRRWIKKESLDILRQNGLETLVVNLDFDRTVGNLFSQTATVPRGTCGSCSACDQFPCGLGVVVNQLGVQDRFCHLDSSQDEFFFFQIVAEFHQLATNERLSFQT